MSKKKVCYEIHFYESDFVNLKVENANSHLKRNRIKRDAKFQRILEQALDVLSVLDADEEPYLTNTEYLIKQECIDFMDDIETKISNYLQGNESEEIFEKYFEVGKPEMQFREYGGLEVVNIVNPDFECSEEQREIANTVFSYFHFMPIADLYYFYVSRVISEAKFECGPIERPLGLSIRWAAMTLLHLACAKHEQALDIAHYCLGLALGYSESWKSNLETYELLDELGFQFIESGEQKKDYYTDKKAIAKKAIFQFQQQKNDELLHSIRASEVFSHLKVNPVKHHGTIVNFPDKSTIQWDDQSWDKAGFLKVLGRILKQT